MSHCGDPPSIRGGEGRRLYTTWGTRFALFVPGPRASDGMGKPGTSGVIEGTFCGDSCPREYFRSWDEEDLDD